MPIALIIAGIVLIDLAFRGTEHDTAKLLAKDFGQGSQFWSWAAAVGIVGALGYAAPLRGISRALLALILVGMVLKNGGLFAQLADIIKNPPKALPAVSLSSYAGVVFGSGSSSSTSASSGGSGAKKAGGLIADIAGVALAPETGGASLALAAVANEGINAA